MNHLSTFAAARNPLVSDFSGPTPPDNEQASVWQQVLAHSINGLVGLVAVRDNSEPNAPVINFRYQFLNQTALRDTFRFTPHLLTEVDVVGRLLTDFFPSIRETAIWNTYVTVIETGEACRIEQNYKADGHDTWSIQSVAPFGCDGLLLSYSETSDLHHTARRLSRQTTLLNGVLNSSPNAILVFEAIRDAYNQITDFQVTLTNRQFDLMTGQPSGRFVGSLLSSLYPLEPKRLDRLRQMIVSGETLHTDEFVAALGCWLNITLTHLNDGFVATLQDITADRQMRQQLEATVQQLHRSNQNLEQFAYVASHDLQEPLRKIVAFGDVLTNLYSTELSAPAADVVQRMQRSAGRMRSLVQDLLTYSRLSGDAEAFSLIDLNHLVASVVDDLETVISERQALVTLNALPAVWGDSVLLRQLFQNLLSNAIKFQRTDLAGQLVAPRVVVGGYVATLAELPTELALSDDSQAGRRFAIITVSDNGIGFDERYLDRIFTIFQRLHGRMQYAGTGIGLAICKKVVDIHRGHITATSQEGKGATFRLCLPLM